MLRVSKLFQNLSIYNTSWTQILNLPQAKFIHSQSPLFFQATQTLNAEPLKKKKRIDPMILKRQEERRKKRMEKQIRILERNEKQLKPVEELEVDRKLLEEKQVRSRALPKRSEEVINRRLALKREWSDYKRAQFNDEMKCASRMIASRDKALSQLRIESEELYQEAIQLDPMLFPYTVDGPVDTPPITNYEPADGIYTDKTRVWAKRSVLPGESRHKKKK